MKRFFLLLFVFATIDSMAQVGRIHSTNISAGLDFVLPTSTFAQTQYPGPGLTLKGEYVFAKHVSTTISGSFYRLRNKETDHLDLIPVLAGLRYYLGSFYVGAEAGQAWELEPGNRSGLVYAFSAGDEIVSGRNGNSLDVSLRIQTWNPETRLNFYGLRVSYEFRLR